MLFLDIGYLSDKGNKRKTNQDRVLAVKNEQSALFVIADGMGGMESGEYASTLVVRKMQEWWNQNNEDFADIASDKAMDMLYDEISNINTSIIELCRKNNIKTGTTLSLLFINNDYAVAAYSGDTRIYRIRADLGEVIQISEDETLYNYYEKYEDRTEKQNADRNKSILISYIGKADSVSASFKEFTVMSGDIFILCSDGFYHYFNFYGDVNINMLAKLKAQEACQNFISDVKNGEAKDNLSLVVVKCI